MRLSSQNTRLLRKETAEQQKQRKNKREHTQQKPVDHTGNTEPNEAYPHFMQDVAFVCLYWVCRRMCLAIHTVVHLDIEYWQ